MGLWTALFVHSKLRGNQPVHCRKEGPQGDGHTFFLKIAQKPALEIWAGFGFAQRSPDTALGHCDLTEEAKWASVLGPPGPACLRAGWAINGSGGIVKPLHNRPLYAISEQTFLWRARENLSEKVVFFFFAVPDDFGPA